MNNIVIFVTWAATICVGMLLLLEIGRRIGRKHRERYPDGIKGTGPIEGAIFGLMGLLLAFTFSGAGDRFEKRRTYLVQETNAIGTAYLRISLLPESARMPLRDLFRQYVDARIAYDKNLSDVGSDPQARGRAIQLQADIWNLATQAAKQEPNSAVLNLVSASLNEMIDITTTREQAQLSHPPTEVYVMLGFLLLCCSLIAGYELAAGKWPSWLHRVGFAVILSVTVYMIFDYEYPRGGLLRIDGADQMLIDLRAAMK